MRPRERGNGESASAYDDERSNKRLHWWVPPSTLRVSVTQATNSAFYFLPVLRCPTGP